MKSAEESGLTRVDFVGVGLLAPRHRGEGGMMGMDSAGGRGGGSELPDDRSRARSRSRFGKMLRVKDGEES